MSLASNIQYLMLSDGISQVELSQKTHIDRTTITKILNGSTTNPRYETLDALAKYFKINVNELLDTLDNETYQSSKNSNSISQIISRLMEMRRITTITELSNQTNVPISVISDLINKKTTKPNNKTLKLLSNYFNINATQLMGFEPLPNPEKITPLNNDRLSLPLLTLEQSHNWIHNKNKNNFKYINIHTNITLKNIYAIIIKNNFYTPDIFSNSTLIITPVIFFNQGDIIIGKLNKRTISIYELISHNNIKTILREFGTKTQTSVPNEDLEILGTVAQIIME